MINKDCRNKWLVPKDYTIQYDKNKNYNEIACEEGEYLPPYRNDFPSIYKGIEIEMHIVEHCNLNCNCCNHFSPLAKPKFISLEDFINEVTELKENIPNIKTFLILGGEPTLHPQLFEICMNAREILGPEVYIDVLSNGTIIDKIALHKDEYLNKNIHFTFSSYYQKTKLDEIKKLKPLGRVFNTRILSKQTLVEPNGFLDGHYNFFNCINHKLPCFTLKNHKLFICPFSAHIDIYCEHTGNRIDLIKDIDYLLVPEINNNLDKIQTFCFTPKRICNFCKPGPSVPFTESSKDSIEFELSINSLYFNDYPRYEKIINAGKNGLITWATNENLNPGRVDIDYETHNFETELLRYKTGKIDIIIPYYNENIHQFIKLRETLLNQTIIKDCVIYFISDNSNMDLAVLNTFSGYSDLHCVFLRNEISKGPGGTRNKGIINSYNKYLLFFDADNSFIKNTALEEIYMKISQSQLNLVSWENYDEKHQHSQQGFCVNRTILNKNELLFKELYFGEDTEFYTRLISSIPKDEIYEYNNSFNIFIEYNTTANNNITSTFIHYDKLHFSLFSSGFIGLKEAKINNFLAYSKMETAFLNHIIILAEEHPFLTKNTFLRSLMAYELYILKQINPLLINKNEYLLLNKLFYLNEDEDMSIIKNYLLIYLQNNYLNNSKLANNAKIIMNLLEDNT